MEHSCNPSTWEPEALKSQVPGQPKLHGKPLPQKTKLVQGCTPVISATKVADIGRITVLSQCNQKFC
jgi:hypothetical protein